MSITGKITRSQLKALVKECLVEILQEGLSSVNSTAQGVNLPANESYTRNTQQQRQQPKRISPLDMPANVQDVKRKPSAAMAEAIRIETGGNKLMSDILADTAMTTLPKMLSGGDQSLAESSMQKSTIQQVEKIAGTPEQIFGIEAASKWASLAFNDTPAKKTM